MAEAELRLKAVLDDDASPGIDRLDRKLEDSASATESANKRIGSSSAKAASQTVNAAKNIATATGSAARTVATRASEMTKAIAGNSRVISGAVRGAKELAEGWRNGATAASTFGGKLSNLGGAAKRAVNAGRDIGQGIVRGFKGAVSGMSKAIKSEVAKGAADGIRELQGAATAVTAGGLAAAWNFSQLAADAEQNIGAVTTVFGEADQKIMDWSKNSVDSVGMSSSAYQRLANSLGGSLTSAGWDMDTMAGKSNELLGAAADLSSVFGGSATEAAEALGAGLRGEFDSLERFGVFLTADKIAAELAANGQDKLTGSALEAAKKQATVGLIMDQASKYTGNFAREADTASGAQQRAVAAWEEARIALGTYLLPILTQGADLLKAFSYWAIENERTVGALAIGVFAVAGSLTLAAAAIAAYQGALAVYAIGQGVAAAAVWLHSNALNKATISTAAYTVVTKAAAVASALLTIAMIALPWVAVTVAIAAVIAAIVLAYNKIGWFKDGVNAAWEMMKVAASAVADWTVRAWTSVVEFFSSAWASITATATVAWAGIQAVLRAVSDWWVSTIVPLWDSALRGLGTAFRWFKDTIIDPVWFGIRMTVAVVIGVLMTLWDGISWVLRNTLGPAFTWFRDSVITPVWAGIRSVIQGVATWWTGTVVPGFKAAITILQVAWQFLLNNVVRPVWTAIRAAIQAVQTWWSSVIVPAFRAAINTLQAAWRFLLDNVIRPVWSAIRAAIQAVQTWWTTVIVPAFRAALNILQNAFRFYLDNVIRPVWAAVRAVISAAWTFIRNTVFTPIVNFLRSALGPAFTWLRDNVISPVWTRIRDILSAGWSFIRDRVFSPLRTFVTETIPNAFNRAADAVRTAWNRIQDIVKAPVKFVIDTVINGSLIKNINSVLKTFKMDPIPEIRSGFKSGGYTGAGNPNEAAGIVHRDEQVIRSPSRRSVEDRFPGLLDDMNRRGAAALANPAQMAVGAPVYGGKGSFSNPLQHNVFSSGMLKVSGAAPGYDLLGAIRMVDNATKVKVQKGSGGNNTVHVQAANYPDWWAGYYSGNSIRLNNTVAGGMNQAAKRVMTAHEIGHALGLPHSDPGGGQSMMSYANMYNHNSVTDADVRALSAIYGGSGFASGGGGLDILGMITSGIDKLLDSIASKFEGTAGQIALGAGKYVFGQAKDWATKQLDSINPFGGGASRGMVLPGYSPRRDQTPIMASRGESVLTPELTRALGPGNIMAANLATSGGLTPASRNRALGLLGAGGGISGGGINVDLRLTVEGNMDMDVLEQVEDRIESAMTNALASANARGY